jgi:hypothetical protein
MSGGWQQLKGGWQGAVQLALVLCSSSCAPLVVEAFEPPPEPVAVAPVTCAPGSLKQEPGSCGCDVPDEDFDGDGSVDCLEACPDNAGQVAPVGPCGCSSFADTEACGQLRAAVRNLYTFDGQGTAVVDSRGAGTGALLHLGGVAPEQLAQLQRNGRLTLDGLGSYVDLPDGIISSLTDATFEAWISWRGGGPWARVFDFGNNAGTPVDGVTYLFLTPSAGNGALRLAYSLAGPTQEATTDAQSALPVHAAPEDTGADHLAVVIDRSNAWTRLFANGVEIAANSQALDLSAISDVNNWLGRSNYLVDPPIAARLIEFRIYAQALTAEQVSASFLAGPGALD